MDALGGGHLAGSVAGDVACFWADEQPPNRTAFVWPFGFSARDDPLRIVGPDQQDLATVGDLVALGGGSLPGAAPPPRTIDPCGIGKVFFVASVVSTNGVELNIGEGSLRLVYRPDNSPLPCPEESVGPMMLVMSSEHLQLRDIAGIDHEVRWPTGYAVQTDPIRVVDRSGSVIAVQGRETSELHAVDSNELIDVCEA